MNNTEHPLKVWRAEKGVTLQGLAELCGMHNGSLSLVENDKRGLSFKTIRKLSKITGIPAGLFVRDVARRGGPQ